MNASQITKALVLDTGSVTLLLLMPGDARVDNEKFTERFAARPRFLSSIEAVRLTPRPERGIGPFGMLASMPVYADIKLREAAVVCIAPGGQTGTVAISPAELRGLADAEWVDVCR